MVGHEENQLLEGAPVAEEKSAGPEGPHYLSCPAAARESVQQLLETAVLLPPLGSTSQDLMEGRSLDRKQPPVPREGRSAATLVQNAE